MERLFLRNDPVKVTLNRERTFSVGGFKSVPVYFWENKLRCNT